MCDLIVSVPDHCLSFFTFHIFTLICIFIDCFFPGSGYFPY